MNLEQFAMAGFVLIGLINGFKLLETNKRGFLYFLMAVVLGTVFGQLKLFGLPGFEIGLAMGISSSGVYKVAQKIGGKS